MGIIYLFSHFIATLLKTEYIVGMHTADTPGMHAWTNTERLFQRNKPCNPFPDNVRSSVHEVLLMS